MLGVLVRSYFDWGAVPVYLVLMLGGACVLVLRSRLGLVAGLFVLSVGLGVVRTELALRALEPYPVFAEGAMVVIEGVVVREPDLRDTKTLLTVDVDMVDGGNAALRIRASVPQYPEAAYGDRVSLKGKITVPDRFETESGRVFDYPNYLKKEGVHYEMMRPTVSILSSGEGNPFVHHLLSLKHAWLQAIALVVPEPRAALLGGLVVGAKQSLGETWLSRFRDTGIVHIVVLSGFNLTIVADAITRLTQFLPRSGGFSLGLLGIAGFALMTGASATVVRASIMAALGLTARYLNRPYSIVRALSLAALIMVLHNPLILAFDPGFQLSFIATLGLVLGSPLVVPYLTWVPEGFQVREIVAATLATQAAVLPLLLYQVGELSIVALPVNLLVLPLVPATMGIGLVAGLFGSVAPVLALPLAFVADLLLSFMFTVVHHFSLLPFASVGVPPLPFAVVGLLYGAVGLWLHRRFVRAERALSVQVSRTDPQ